MKSLIVSWEVEPTPLPPGTKPAHHFKVGCGLQEVDVALDVLSHTFQVEPGIWSGFVVVCAADGTELSVPITFKDVEVLDDVVVPVPVRVHGVAA